jgi:hypothetical protein
MPFDSSGNALRDGDFKGLTDVTLSLHRCEVHAFTVCSPWHRFRSQMSYAIPFGCHNYTLHVAGLLPCKDNGMTCWEGTRGGMIPWLGGGRTRTNGYWSASWRTARLANGQSLADISNRLCSNLWTQFRKFQRLTKLVATTDWRSWDGEGVHINDRRFQEEISTPNYHFNETLPKEIAVRALASLSARSSSQ